MRIRCHCAWLVAMYEGSGGLNGLFGTRFRGKSSAVGCCREDHGIRKEGSFAGSPFCVGIGATSRLIGPQGSLFLPRFCFVPERLLLLG